MAELTEQAPAQLNDAPATSRVPPQLQRFTWTSAQASAAARRKHELERIRKGSAQLALAHIPQTAPDERIVLLAEQIARTRMTLNGDLEPQHRAALLRALCDLLDQQRIARGEPLPGSLKPSGGPARAPAWTEEPQAACGPGTPSSSGPAPPPPALEDTSSEVSI